MPLVISVAPIIKFLFIVWFASKFYKKIFNGAVDKNPFSFDKLVNILWYSQISYLVILLQIFSKNSTAFFSSPFSKNEKPIPFIAPADIPDTTS